MYAKTIPVPSRRASRPERVLLLLVAAILLLASVLGAQQPERYVLGGDRVALYNLAGTITVQPGTGDDVVVELRRGGRDSQELEVKVGGWEGDEALRVLYPNGRIVYPEASSDRFRTSMTGVGSTWGHRVFGKRQWEVVRSGSGTEAWADAVVRVPAGKRVKIVLATGRMTAAGVEGDVILDGGSASATARDLRGSLLIDLGSGSALAEDIDGDLNIDTGSGDVRVARVRGGHVLFDTGSGDVSGRDIRGDLEVDTGSGDVTLTGVSSTDILVDTGSGDVRLALAGDVDDLEIDTGSGSVTVELTDAVGAALTVDTGSGGIDVDVPHYVVERERSFLRGEIGDSRGRIHIDTGSGGVRLLRP